MGAIALLVAVLSPSWPIWGEEPRKLEECSRALATELSARGTADCVFTAARAGGDEAARAVDLLRQYSQARKDLPWFSFYLGGLRWNHPDEAERLYLRAAEGFRRSGNAEGEVLARINRGQRLDLLGRTREAELEVDRVLEITERSSRPELYAWGQIILARRLLGQGEDLSRAYDLLRDVEIPAGTDRTFSLSKERLVALGEVCMVTGRFGEAQDVYRQLVDLAEDEDYAEEEGRAYVEAEARYSLAWVAYERLREAPTAALREETLERARAALNAASEGTRSAAMARASWILGVLTPGEEGRRFLEDCYAATENPSIRSHCLNYLANRIVAVAPKEAREVMERSQKLAVQSGDAWTEVRYWQAYMQLVWKLEPRETALSASWRALDVIESLRDRQRGGSQAQAGLFSVWSDDYAWLAGRLLEAAEANPGDDAVVGDAFVASERMRARALVDWLWRTDVERVGVAAAGFRRLEDVQATLTPEEALVSFQVARWQDLSGFFAGGSWSLTVTRDDVTVHRLPGRVDVRRAVDLFDGLIERRDGAEARVAARLYDDLLAPALADLPPEVDRLILVPDDALHRLPFAALRESPDAEPLGARFELVQVPSATLWLEWRQARDTAPERPILVLADPDSPSVGEEPEESEVAVAQVRDAGRGLGRLPHARREGRAAVRALGGDGLLLVGAEASEARLDALPLGDFGLIHFAAHALTDENRPERSAVLLAPGGGADGLLESAEIAGLGLAGRTVVLASCRSASGTVLRGEGVMSLARAFFQAGAHGVVASLWPLRDDESEATFDRFYRHLGEGDSIAGALHRARREAIDAGEPAAAWAGLVVLGDGATVPVPGGRRSVRLGSSGWLGVWILLALALVAGAVAAWRHRARGT